MNDLKETDIKRQLDRIDLWLKRIGIWGAIIGLAVSIMTFLNLMQQRALYKAQEKLVSYQANEEAEKRAVNVSMEMIPFESPNGDGLYLKAAFNNSTARRIRIAMIGIRIWKKGWRKDTNVCESPNLLLYSETRVTDCPITICGESGKATPTTRLFNDKRPVELARGEKYAYTLGPYSIPAKEWKQGVWIEGCLYTTELDEGTCIIVGPPLCDGAFPKICEEWRKSEVNCQVTAKCLHTCVPETFFRPGKRSTDF